MQIKWDKKHDIAEAMKSYLDEHEAGPFWTDNEEVVLDYDLLAEGLAIPLSTGESVQTGRFAASVDMWIAQELARAGFDGMWPRLSEPRAIDPEVIHAVEALPKRMGDVGSLLLARAGAADANVMGSVFVKQVDAGLSSWLSGPELLISTKTMSGSFGKNLANRFEEAYGDVKNLRARYPLAAHGFFFLVRSAIVGENAALDKAVHMLRQLSRSGDVYDAVCLLITDWDDTGAHVRVPSLYQTLVPEDLQPEAFFKKLIDVIFAASPIDSHKEARALRKGK